MVGLDVIGVEFRHRRKVGGDRKTLACDSDHAKCNAPCGIISSSCEAGVAIQYGVMTFLMLVCYMTLTCDLLTLNIVTVTVNVMSDFLQR